MCLTLRSGKIFPKQSLSLGDLTRQEIWQEQCGAAFTAGNPQLLAALLPAPQRTAF